MTRDFQSKHKSAIGGSEPKAHGLRKLVLLLPVVLLFVGYAPLRSQQAPASTQVQGQAPGISVDVKMVSMLATVRDKHGKLVNTLTKDDFAAEQDGHPQTITYFAKESDLPLTLGLLVDTSGSQRRVLDQERSASHAFLDHVLREDRDKAFVIHFDYEVELLQDLTSSRKKLEASLDQLGEPEFSQTGGGRSSGGGSGGGGSGSGGRGGHHRGGGTLLYDAVYLASNEMMKKQQGRKALIILSDGVDNGSKETLLDAIETAQRTDTLVYSILFADNDAYGNAGGFGGPRGGRGGMGGGGRGRYPRNRALTGKRFSREYRRKQAGGCLKYRKSRPSIKFMTRLTKNSAISMAWAMSQLKRMRRPAITRSV